MPDSKAVSTLLDPHVRLSQEDSPKTPEEADEMRNHSYIQATVHCAGSTPALALSIGRRIEFSAAAASSQPSPVVAFTDADHYGNPDNGRSTTGSVLMVAGGPAEFVAASETGRELCWLRNFLADVGAPQSLPLVLNIDNSRQSRHWVWLREAVYDGKIKPVYIPSEDMVADFLTKSLPCETVDKLRRKMGIVGEFSREIG
ncbi:hypothetical protein E4T56_gene6001 [Termitomyces sp. T112]|nr:hypothetical protein E4T56_gene6001 [Termitomyces sp. T112]